MLFLLRQLLPYVHEHPAKHVLAAAISAMNSSSDRREKRGHQGGFLAGSSVMPLRLPELADEELGEDGYRSNDCHGDGAAAAPNTAGEWHGFRNSG